MLNQTIENGETPVKNICPPVGGAGTQVALVKTIILDYFTMESWKKMWKNAINKYQLLYLTNEKKHIKNGKKHFSLN